MKYGLSKEINPIQQFKKYSTIEGETTIFCCGNKKSSGCLEFLRKYTLNNSKTIYYSSNLQHD